MNTLEPQPDDEGKCNPADTVSAMRELIVDVLEQVAGVGCRPRSDDVSPKQWITDQKANMVRSALGELLEALDT